MGDLLQTNNPVYMMLPLDESPFLIHANSREISVPAEFAKCGAIKGDNYCEIATFVVDRYFDFKDLAETNIAVQWVNAEGEEGISHIQLIDLEKEGKIRFGWPLTADITKKAGPVRFAVRFFVKDPVVQDKFIYLLNTETKTLTVKESLNVVNPTYERRNDYGEFAAFVKNSQHPSFTSPDVPMFAIGSGGFDLMPVAAIDLDTNTLELKAQAIAKDGGSINYQWYFVPAGSNEKQVLVTNATYDVENIKYAQVHLEIDEDGNVLNEKKQDKYFVEAEVPGVYVPYAGAWPPAADAVLYEIISQVNIVDSENEVVGEYWVEAVNTIGKYSTNPVESAHCRILAPQEIEYLQDGNLVAHKFADKDNGVELAIKLKADPNNPHMAYKWFKSTEGIDQEYSEILDPAANSATYVAKEPGWYKVSPEAKLNRKVEKADSNICKVTFAPAAPQISSLSWKFKDSKDDFIVLGEDEEMPDIFQFGNLISLKVNTNLDNADPLQTEGLSYVWYVQEQNRNPRELTEKDKGDNLALLHPDTVLNSNTIHVRCLANTENDAEAFSYFCEITNKIANKTAKVNSSDYNTFTIK